MKQEIICKTCYPELKETFPSDNPYPGEHVKFVEGTAKLYMTCDHCNSAIIFGEECYAFTIWADYGGQPYFPWEDKYLILKQ